MYQPNFCAECGERVERAGRRAWSSRRFCPLCARRFRTRRALRPLVLACVLVAVGFIWGRAGRPQPQPAVTGRGALSLAPLKPAGGAGREDGSAGRGGQGATTGAAYGPDGSAGERPTEPDEVVSVCGARTKKGTPCQRRVRGEGRCWQHRGKAAMLPPAKLIVPN
jgi:hypothetical protein